MRIAITSTGETLESDLDPRFGRAVNFVIYDSEKKTIESLKNEHINAQGGAGSSAAKTIADKNTDIIISGNFGPNATTALKAFGIKMYTSEVDKLSTIIEKLQNGNLKEIKDATVKGSHG